MRQDYLKQLQLVIDSGLELIKKTKPNHTENQAMMDGFLLFQMCVLRAISVRNLSRQNKHISELDRSELNAIDVASMLTILRAITEVYCVFNNIYIASKSEDELRLKHLLWVVAALKEKQNAIAIEPEYEALKIQEAEKINEINSEIFSNEVFLRLDERSKQILEDEMSRKNYRIKIDGQIARYANWKDLLTQAKLKSVLKEQVLITTLTSHPSNYSIARFGPRYSDEKMLELEVSYCLEMTTYMLAFFIADYCCDFLVDLKVFKSLPDEHRRLIIQHNKILREQ